MEMTIIKKWGTEEWGIYQPFRVPLSVPVSFGSSLRTTHSCTGGRSIFSQIFGFSSDSWVDVPSGCNWNFIWAKTNEFWTNSRDYIWVDGLTTLYGGGGGAELSYNVRELSNLGMFAWDETGKQRWWGISTFGGKKHKGRQQLQATFLFWRRHFLKNGNEMVRPGAPAVYILIQTPQPPPLSSTTRKF